MCERKSSEEELYNVTMNLPLRDIEQFIQNGIT